MGAGGRTVLWAMCGGRGERGGEEGKEGLLRWRYTEQA
jgi:hypothetical protein